MYKLYTNLYLKLKLHSENFLNEKIGQHVHETFTDPISIRILTQE
jgi:hypothetical protein